MRIRILIIATFCLIAFTAMALLGLSAPRLDLAAQPQTQPPERIPSGIVVSLNIYPARKDKPVWICPLPAGTGVCKNTVFTYPQRYEACLGSYTGPTACWYVEANAWSRLRRNNPVPASVPSSAFTEPHSVQGPGSPTGQKVIDTKTAKGRS